MRPRLCTATSTRQKRYVLPPQPIILIFSSLVPSSVTGKTVNPADCPLSPWSCGLLMFSVFVFAGRIPCPHVGEGCPRIRGLGCHRARHLQVRLPSLLTRVQLMHKYVENCMSALAPLSRCLPDRSPSLSLFVVSQHAPEDALRSGQPRRYAGLGPLESCLGPARPYA